MSLVATEALIRTLDAEKFIGLAKATVVADFEPTTDLRVTFDDDTEPSHVQSLVGELQADQRVMVLFTEPHGAYVAWLLHPPAWRALTLGSGWSNRGTVASIEYQPAEIRRVGDDVEMRGVVYRSSGVGTTTATAPAGFRSPLAEGFPGESSGAYCSLFVFSSGVVYYNGGGTPGSALSLSSIRYSVSP